MEIFFLPIAALFLFIIIIITNFRSFRTHNTNKNLPPQPWKLPVVGHLHHLSGSQPHRALGNLANKLGPILHLELGEVSAILISSPPFAKEILKTHDISFASRPKLLSAEIIGRNYTDIAFCPYGDYWRQMRKICVMELFSAKKVQSFRSLREQESRNLVESIAMHIQRSEPVNLTDMIFTMINTFTCRVAVGSKCKDQELLLALSDELVLLSSGFHVSDLFPSIKVLPLITGMRNKLVKIGKQLDVILDEIILEHQQRISAGKEGNNENEDLLDVLLRLKDDGGLQVPLTFDNIKAVILDVFVAGTDTSAGTIEWAMVELMKNPSVMKKAKVEVRKTLNGKKEINELDIQELDYLKLVVKETLRMHPPVPLLLPRECRETCEIGGYNIPINTKVIVNAWKIGRDPEYWTDPESFIPERFAKSSSNMIGTEFEYLPFGGGRRMCPGLVLGLASVELTLATLLYHFNWDLPNGAISKNIDMDESFGATLKRKSKLVLVPSPYNTK